MPKNTENKLLHYFDLLLAHLADRKGGTPTASGYRRSAVCTLVLAALLLTLTVLDEWCLVQVRLQMDTLLLVSALVITILFAACGIRSLLLAKRLHTKQ